MNVLSWLFLWNIIGNYVLYVLGALTIKTCDEDDALCQLNVVVATSCISILALGLYPLVRVYQLHVNVDKWGQRAY